MHDPIDIALAEDLGEGDLTARFFIPAKKAGLARIVAREKCILAGIQTAGAVFRRVDPALSVSATRKDGDQIERGDAVMEISGLLASILTAERVALNFLQRLSGIATKTRPFVDAIRDTRTQILDTRKTTPGLRALEKAAVRAGGGGNHRSTLSEMILVKDNHLATNGDRDALQKMVGAVRETHGKIRIEFEADTLEQVRQFLTIDGIDTILLDNMSIDEMAEAVRAGTGRVKFEASGNVSLETVAKIAATGVDFISVGALTHSARAIDFSLEVA